MTEQKLDIVKNGEHKNIFIKPKLNKGIKGLENGNYITINKVYADGLEQTGQYGKFYIVKVLYEGEEVSFLLNENEHKAFKDTGIVGDNVRITLNKESMINKNSGIEMLINKLKFEKV